MTSLLASLSTDMNLGFWYKIHVWNTTHRIQRARRGMVYFARRFDVSVVAGYATDTMLKSSAVFTEVMPQAGQPCPIARSERGGEILGKRRNAE